MAEVWSFIKKKWLAILFGTLAICGRVGYYIMTPLWLDHFNGNGTNDTNGTGDNGTIYNNGTTDIGHRINPFFVMLTQYSFCTAVFGIGWVCLLLVAPWRLSDVDRALPPKQIVVIGVASGVSAVLFNFSISSTKTPLYLQAILSNCSIPIQFTIRWVL